MKEIRQLGLCLCTLLAAACGAGTPQNETSREAMMALPPMTTLSAEARQEAAEGLREFDMGRNEEAYTHFERAVAADPSFAFGHWLAGQTAQSQDAFLAHQRAAEQLAGKASVSERNRILMTRKNLDNDDDGFLALALENAKLLRDNPRAWLDLAFAYQTAGDIEKERAAFDSAIVVGPTFALAWTLRANSEFIETPLDLAKAEADAKKAVELEPDEAQFYDFLGDAYRAQGKLEEAGKAYTTCAEKDQTKGGCLQQRGHVNTFLGRFAEARADYDASVQLATGNTKVTLAQYRAFVHLYEGNPKGAIDELDALSGSIDGLNIPEPTGSKIQVDSQLIAVASHYGFAADAERVAARRAKLFDVVAGKTNTPEAHRSAEANKALDQALVAFAKKDYAAVNTHAEQYMTIRAPDKSPTKNRIAHDLEGMAAIGQKQYAQAIAHFDQGYVGNPYFDYYKAVALDATGKKAEAQKLFDGVAHWYFNSVGTAMVKSEMAAKTAKPKA